MIDMIYCLYHLRRVVVFLSEAGLLSVQGRVGDGCRVDSNLGWVVVVTLARATEGLQPLFFVFLCPLASTSFELVGLALKSKEVFKSELVGLAQKNKEVFKSVLLHILNHLSEQEPVTVRLVPTDIGYHSPVVVRLPDHVDPDLREHEADSSVDDGHSAADS